MENDKIEEKSGLWVDSEILQEMERLYKEKNSKVLKKIEELRKKIENIVSILSDYERKGKEIPERTIREFGNQIKEIEDEIDDLEQIYDSFIFSSKDCDSQIDAVNLKNTLSFLEFKYFKLSRKLDYIRYSNIESNVSYKREKIDRLFNEYQNLGHSVLSMVISISIIAASITAIDKINSNYLPLFILVIVWLCMTSIMFNHSLFGKFDTDYTNGIQVSRNIYFVITILTVTVLVFTIIFVYPNINPLGNENNSNDDICYSNISSSKG